MVIKALIVANRIMRMPALHFCKKMQSGVDRFKIIVMSLLFIMLAEFLPAQTTVNVATGTLQFLNANRVSIVGNGTAVGNKILYTNVITLNGQQIDCIVTTLSLTNGTFTLPSGGSGTPHDYSSTTGTGISANSDAYFSPTFNFGSGGGSARFRFNFILGGSYNATTNPTGTPVILENLRLSTYDLDGNGTAGTNQYAEFGGFSSYTLGSPTNVIPSYNSTSGLTKFRSNTSANITNVTDSRQRATVDFASVSEFDLLVGADGGGVSYFFMDFSAGVTWSPTTTTTTTYTPRLDLNTSTTGINNSVSDCYAVQSMTYGGTNLTNVSSGFVNEINIEFTSTDILNGANEVMSIAGATGSNQLALNFSTSGIQTFSLGGVTYSLARSVASGVSTINITKTPSGGWTAAQAEALLDSIRYANTASTKTSGTRTFGVSVREGSLLTPKANFIVQIPCTILGLTWVDFQIHKRRSGVVELRWTVSETSESKGFYIQYSFDGINWEDHGYLASEGSEKIENSYTYQLSINTEIQSFYRICHVDENGKSSVSSSRTLSVSENTAVRVWPNPFNEGFYVFNPNGTSTQFMIVDMHGRMIITDELANRTNLISSLSWPSGRYKLLLFDKNGEVTSVSLIKK